MTKITADAFTNPSSILPLVELRPNDFELQRKDLLIHQVGNVLQSLRTQLVSFENFENEFDQVFKHKKLQQKRQELLKKLSDEYLSNYPEYEGRVKVLRELKYIDEEDRGNCEANFFLIYILTKKLLNYIIFKYPSSSDS